MEPHNPEFGEANRDVDEPIEGIMTTHGYILPYPTKNRFSVWFTGGTLEIKGNKAKTKQIQECLFNSVGERTLSERSKLFVAKVLMGASVTDEMDEHGRVSYHLTRPLAAYIDLLYIDESLRIMRSSSGVVYIFTRVQDAEDVSTVTSATSFESMSSIKSIFEKSTPTSSVDPVRPVRRGSDTSNCTGSSLAAPRRPRRSESPARQSSTVAPPVQPRRCQSPKKETASAPPSQPQRCRSPRKQPAAAPPLRPSHYKSLKKQSECLPHNPDGARV